jgi:excisionase family DNA binding protein
MREFGLHPFQELYDKITRKIEQRKAMHLSATEVDWFVVSGAYETLMKAVVDQNMQLAAARLRQQGHDLSFLGFDEPTDRLDGEKSSAAEMPEVFSVRSLAEWWGVSQTTVHARIKSGDLKYFKLGKLFRIRKDAVQKYEREHAIQRRS